MSAMSDASDRDEVLSSFLETCPAPSAIQIEEWCEKFPRFAEHIEDLAAGLRILKSQESDGQFAAPTAVELAQERQNALTKLRALEQRRSARSELTCSYESSWQETFGSRLRAIREAKTISLDALAEAIGKGAAPEWIRNIEADAIFPGIEAIRSLSRTLNVSAAYLVNADNLRLVDVSPRNAHSLVPHELRKIEVEAIVFAHRYLDLEAKLKERLPMLSNVGMRTPQEAEQAAADLRALWGLGHGPIKSVTSLLEGNGVKILPLNMGRCDGLALRIDEDGQPKTQIILLPSDALRSSFPTSDQVSMAGIIGLKQKYGVSLQAIIKRCLVIGLLNDEQAKHFNKACDNAGGLGNADLGGFSESTKRYDELREKARISDLNG
jgi:transcriptional regulator with XRE-family HTH domain